MAMLDATTVTAVKAAKAMKTAKQGWAIPGFGQQYYTQYYTGQKYAKLYNTLYQYYTKSKQPITSVKEQQNAILIIKSWNLVSC
jgi:hypothetical protein